MMMMMLSLAYICIVYNTLTYKPIKPILRKIQDSGVIIVNTGLKKV